MLSRLTGLKITVAVIGLCGALGLAVPALAQENAHKKMDNNQVGPSPQSTGVGERGSSSKVAPSTEPGGAASNATDTTTGVGQRGTKVAPSTEPGKSGGTTTGSSSHHTDRD